MQCLSALSCSSTLNWSLNLAICSSLSRWILRSSWTCSPVMSSSPVTSLARCLSNFEINVSFWWDIKVNQWRLIWFTRLLCQYTSTTTKTGEEENQWQLSSSASVFWKVVRVRSFLFPSLSSAITSFERMFFLLLFQVAASLRPRCVSCGTNWKKYVIGDQAVCLKDTRV